MKNVFIILFLSTTLLKAQVKDDDVYVLENRYQLYFIQNVIISSSNLEANVNGYTEPAIRLYHHNLGSKEFNIDNILIGLLGRSVKYYLLSYTNQYPVYAYDF